MERGSRACGGDGALVRAGSKSNALRGEVSSGVGWCCCDGDGCDDDGTEGDDEARELPLAPGQAASSLAFSGLPAALELRLSCGTLVRAQAVGSSWSAASVECCPAACPWPAGRGTYLFSDPGCPSSSLSSEPTRSRHGLRLADPGWQLIPDYGRLAQPSHQVTSESSLTHASPGHQPAFITRRSPQFIFFLPDMSTSRES